MNRRQFLEMCRRGNDSMTAVTLARLLKGRRVEGGMRRADIAWATAMVKRAKRAGGWGWLADVYMDSK